MDLVDVEPVVVVSGIVDVVLFIIEVMEVVIEVLMVVVLTIVIIVGGLDTGAYCYTLHPKLDYTCCICSGIYKRFFLTGSTRSS
ncbi:hypothetical protein NL676_014296 [Syzygium grande]|nr:hypothetical protein NL676_014296 [Syzygium grande]